MLLNFHSLTELQELKRYGYSGVSCALPDERLNNLLVMFLAVHSRGL